MMLGLLLFAPAVLIGWFVVRMLVTGLVITPGRSGWTGAMLEISLGTGVGVGIVAMVFFALVWAGAAGRAVLLSVEAIMAAGGAWLVFRQPTVKSDPGPAAHSSSRTTYGGAIWLLRAAAALALLFFALDAAKSIEAEPDGGWDAFSIWNVKAKFLAGGPGAWRNAMAPVAGGTLVGASHPGYPLLLPSAVASAWTIQGESASAAPSALGVLFTFATAAMLCGAVAYLRGEAAGLIALLLLVASEGFASQAGSQNADIPLGLYLLATLALIAFAGDHGWPHGTLLLAGLCCGLAAWTKNEGLPFAILTLAAVAWKAGRKAAGWMALGAVPAVALLAAFKILLVHDAEAVLPKTLGEAFAKVTDVSRWMQITASFVQSIWQMGTPWAHPVMLAAILAFALGLAPRTLVLQQIWLAVPVVGLLAADFLVYLTTTADLTWHLSTSNLRLMVQVWPALLLLTFLVIAPPALPAAPSLEMQRPVRGKAERKRSKGSRVLHAK
jgi:hypothetical protein